MATFLLRLIVPMLPFLANAANADASHNDYSGEWLTAPATCPDTLQNGTGVTKDPFNETITMAYNACCIFCHSQTSKKCVAWTWHSDTKKCFVSDAFSPHSAKHTVSSMEVAPPPVPPMPVPKPPLGFQPNFVFILTDDQDVTLGRHNYTDIGSLEAMPGVRTRLAGEGVSMRHFYVNTPICCPSRTEFMSGRYYHNVGPPKLEGSCMHADTSFAAKKTTSLFGLLTTAGYNTGVFGKVTNDQGKILDLAVKEGSMSFIDSPLDYNDYNSKTYFRHLPNGTTYTETLDAISPVFNTTYQTSQIGNRTLQWLDAAIAASKGDRAVDGSMTRSQTRGERVPFLAYIGPHAPHFPAEPAPWYKHAFDDITIPITPNYNLSCPDKAQHIRQNPPLTQRVECWENQHFRNRWATLLSVDEIVTTVLDKLEAAQVMNETYVLYSSDHGYKQGQWRVGTSKQHPYETDVRVPFIIRGPGIPKGQVLPHMTGNVDVTPTLLDLAAGPEYVAAAGMDGRSMMRLLVLDEGSLEAHASKWIAAANQAKVAPWRQQFLNEYKSVGTYYNDHSAVWEDGDTTTKLCGGGQPRGPAEDEPKSCKESSGVGDGECYFVDSTLSNSWRQLRIVNESSNLNYVEYDPAFTFAGMMQHHELYNQTSDPFQMRNIYEEQSDTVKQALHSDLAKYFRCKADTCP